MVVSIPHNLIVYSESKLNDCTLVVLYHVIVELNPVTGTEKWRLFQV